MRDYKFRAWAEKTVDNSLEYAWEKSNTKEIEPDKNSSEWDEWYENRNKYFNEYVEEWNKNNSEKERYTKTLEMITNFKVNGKTQQPYGYKIIDIMQYTGLKDKNGVDIYEGDIVSFIGFKGIIEYDKEKLTFVIKWEADDIINLLETFSKRASTMFEVIGNVWENGDLIYDSK